MTEIYGLDNNVVVIETDIGKNKEINLEPKEVAAITIGNREGAVEIHAWYDSPSWAFTVFQVSGTETPVPWEISLRQDSSYSMRVSIDTGADTIITHEVY